MLYLYASIYNIDKHSQVPPDLQNCPHSLCNKSIYHSSLPHCGHIVPSSTTIFNEEFEVISITTSSENLLLYYYYSFKREFNTSLTLCPRLTNEDISDSSFGLTLKANCNLPSDSKSLSPLIWTSGFGWTFSSSPVMTWKCKFLPKELVQVCFPRPLHAERTQVKVLPLLS